MNTTLPSATLRSAGGLPFLITALLGRLPAAMVQLGYLMVLSQSGYGLATAGLAVGAVGLGTATGAPVVGRLVDRFGPLPVLSGATALSALGQLTFIALLLRDAPAAPLLGCAAIVGLANPQIGPVARSHWSHLAVRLRAPHLVNRAMGYEGAVDETSFVVGPILASLLVSLFGPAPAAATILGCTLALQGLFLAHLWLDRANWHQEAPHAATSATSASAGTRILWPMAACLGVGIMFGSTQTALTALFEQRGTPALTGIIYGCVGIGSGISSLAAGRLPRGWAIPMRIGGGALAMIAGALAMLQLPPSGVAALVALVLGAGAGIVLVSAFSWMERIAPRDRVATMMTLLATCLTLGVSVGAAIAGRLAHVPAHGFWPVAASGVLGLVGALGMHLSRGRRQPGVV